MSRPYHGYQWHCVGTICTEHGWSNRSGSGWPARWRSGGGRSGRPRGRRTDGLPHLELRPSSGAATSVPRRSLAAAGAVGALGWAALLLLVHAGASLAASTALVAVLVGVAGNLVALRQHTHPLLFVVPGIMPLLPGLTIYQGMYELVTSQGHSGLVTLFGALGIGLAIAASPSGTCC
ncbi:MAG: threonine/serine exporter family protein [Acidimicrobiales bacterium]